jgi:hypothetical protein
MTTRDILPLPESTYQLLLDAAGRANAAPVPTAADDQRGPLLLDPAMSTGASSRLSS